MIPLSNSNVNSAPVGVAAEREAPSLTSGHPAEQHVQPPQTPEEVKRQQVMQVHGECIVSLSRGAHEPPASLVVLHSLFVILLLVWDALHINTGRTNSHPY